MYILNPDIYNAPCYRIGPFRTSDLSLNQTLPDNSLIDEYFTGRFKGKKFFYTENGRTAINIALQYFNLQKKDVVTILTTSGNFYISSCVTKEIEKFCFWSREILPETRVIFVNHEFGFPYKTLESLLAYNLPIIEDCAGSFFSNGPDGNVGNLGDFVIYSFPKMFPLQTGGLLVSNKLDYLKTSHCIYPDHLRFIKNVLSYHIQFKSEIIQKRIYNYEFLGDKFGTLGFYPRFSIEPGSVPSVFMFGTIDQKIDLNLLKEYYYSNGVQCSVFYGEQAFFIPVHQALTTIDLNYFYEIIKSFLISQK